MPRFRRFLRVMVTTLSIASVIGAVTIPAQAGIGRKKHSLKKAGPKSGAGARQPFQGTRAPSGSRGGMTSQSTSKSPSKR